MRCLALFSSYTLTKICSIVNVTSFRHTTTMLKTKFSLAVLGVSLLAGCAWSISPNTTTNTVNSSSNPQIYWMEYALTQCNNAPWGKIIEPEVVTKYYSNIITVHAVEVTPPEAGVVFCQACGCPTGTVVSIQTDAAGRTYLLEQGFILADAALDSSLFINEAKTITNQTINSNTNNTIVTNTNDVDTDSNSVVKTTAAAETKSVDSVAKNTNIVESETGDTEIESLDTEPVVEETLSEADANLRDRSINVVSALAEYFDHYGSYPEDLTVLQLTVDLTGITYTPIGALPAAYYDLAVAYTTGAEILNP